MTPPYRLGFAVKVLGGGGMRTSDARRWQSGPHLSHSIEMLDPVLDALHARGLHMFRLSSSTVQCSGSLFSPVTSSKMWVCGLVHSNFVTTPPMMVP